MEDNLVYNRPESFDKDAFEVAFFLYKKNLEEYKKLPWFKKFFVNKPVQPNPQNFIVW